MKNLLSVIIIFILSSSLLAGEWNIKEFETYKLSSLIADASRYNTLEAMLNNHEDKIIPAVAIFMQSELAMLAGVWDVIKHDKIAPDVRVLWTSYNDKLSKMIVTHPNFFRRNNTSLLFELPMSETSHLELLRFVRECYSAKEIEQARSKLGLYLSKYSLELNYEKSILMVNLYFEQYGDLLQIIDFLQKKNCAGFRSFLRNKLAYIDLQIKMMIAASPSLASCEDYKDYIKNAPITLIKL